MNHPHLTEPLQATAANTVQVKIEHLRRVVEDIHLSQTNLAERLSPVLRPSHPVAGTCGNSAEAMAKTAQSPMEEALDDLIHSLTGVHARNVELMQRTAL